MSEATKIGDAKAAVFVQSEKLPEDTKKVQGYDWNSGIDYPKLFKSYLTSGFQATNVGCAINEINKMLASRDKPYPEDKLEIDPFIKRRTHCTIFLGFTSNMISSGIRETIRFLVEHKLVDCLVTTAGGVEEDLIKCLAPTYLGDFHLDGKTLRKKGINRTGNLLVPNDNYCKFEDWIMPLLDQMLEEQRKKNTIWSPTRIIEKLGLEINNKESVCYWAAVNKIPIFCPAITDGSIGDMMFFHSSKNPGLVVDILQDLKRLDTMAIKATNSGIIILGGGLVKHHIFNANVMRNGADFTVLVNTGSEFDGSDAGARPDEAVSWGKISMDAKPVKIFAEATIVFPILVAETFAKYHQAKKLDRK